MGPSDSSIIFICLIMVSIILQYDGTENKESLMPKSVSAHDVFGFALFGEKLWLVKILDKSRKFMIFPSHSMCLTPDPQELFETDD